MFIFQIVGFIFGLKITHDKSADAAFAYMTQGMTEEQIVEAHIRVNEARRARILNVSNWAARIIATIGFLFVITPVIGTLIFAPSFVRVTGYVVPLVIIISMFAWSYRARMNMRNVNILFAFIGGFMVLNATLETFQAITEGASTPVGAAFWTIVGIITLAVTYAIVYLVNARTEALITKYGEPKILAIAKAKVDMLRARPQILGTVIIVLAVIIGFFALTSTPPTTQTPSVSPTSASEAVSTDAATTTPVTPTDAPTPTEAPKSSANIEPVFYDQLRAEYPEVMGTMSNEGILDGVKEICPEIITNGETQESVAAGITRPFQFTKQATKEQAMGIVNKTIEMACIHYEPTTKEGN